LKKWKRLIYIVEDLDMITKLESGFKFRIYWFDIVELIQNVFDLLEMKADKENSLAFENSPVHPIFVKADKDRIQQIVENLLVNSIKYGKERTYKSLL
jgi:two-component system phosphate regulon sensor histidine kinase PhoR